MFKITNSEGNNFITYDIYEVWRYIISSDLNFKITKDYIPISNEMLLKLFLDATGNHNDYMTLYLKLKSTTTLKKYLKCQTSIEKK